MRSSIKGLIKSALLKFESEDIKRVDWLIDHSP